MQITALMVKELRERTGAGMMDCKKALAEADGDMEVAIEEMRKSGVAKAAKKSGRIAAEGVIAVRINNGKEAIMLEVNCETDFVAKDENFLGFVNATLDCIDSERPSDVDELLGKSLGSGSTIEQASQELVSKIGEKISVRRFLIFQSGGGLLGQYMHGTRIGVLVDLNGGDEQLARDIAMHIAGTPVPPVCIHSDDIPQDLLDKEKSIFTAQAEESGKPADIIEKMVTGKLNKYKKEISLLDQPFVKDPDQTIGNLLKSANASVTAFHRFQVGEGMEKRSDNFAEEVMAQAKGE
ncbi:MAG: translation elongation factor Ts [Thiotrichales bacterium]|nr:translation elongation factor Ts [Thiotrichales bacterium]